MSSGDQPGALIGAGRAADVYALGGQQVLRRYRNGDSAEREAGVMAYLAEAGFPVPRVYHASGPDLVMERLAGRDMLADLAARPWLARQHARTLAGLHDRLHAIAAPPSLRAQFGPGDRMLHLDLHPGNVMLTAAGPVVIDWSNVAAGSPAADVAMAWLIIATSEVDAAPLLLPPPSPRSGPSCCADSARSCTTIRGRRWPGWRAPASPTGTPGRLRRSACKRSLTGPGGQPRHPDLCRRAALPAMGTERHEWW